MSTNHQLASALLPTCFFINLGPPVISVLYRSHVGQEKCNFNDKEQTAWQAALSITCNVLGDGFVSLPGPAWSVT